MMLDTPYQSQEHLPSASAPESVSMLCRLFENVYSFTATNEQEYSGKIFKTLNSSKE